MYKNVPRFRLLERRIRLGIINTVSLVCITALFFVPRVPLGPAYHDFADKRAILGIPHCIDVLSNIPFMIVGVWGVFWLLLRSSKTSLIVQREGLPYLVFFTGVGLTGIGSFWYHLSPGNSRLLWDLLPMTCSFMSVVVAQIIERISTRVGFWLFIPLLVLGIASVVYWYFTEAHGHGDYRFYLFVQFYPPILLAMIIGLFPPRYTGTGYLVVAFLLYVMAKLFEHFDKQLYSIGGVVSGHSLKHLTAALSCYCILRMLQRRRVFAGSGQDVIKLPLADQERQPV